MTEEHAADALPPADPEAVTLLSAGPVLVHLPVDIRNMSLVVLAVLASIFVLHWARDVFVPVMLSVLLSYALSPLVNAMER